MEIANRIDVPNVRFCDLLLRQPLDTMKSAAMDMLPQWLTNSVNSMRSLESYGIESLGQALRDVSFNDVVAFAKKHYFIAAIVVGVTVVAGAPLIKLSLISSIKFLHLLTKAGLSIVSPIFKLNLKLTVLSMTARIICHMDLGLLNPITSVIARTIVDPVSVLLMKGMMVLGTLMFIANISV
jgi:hypothetical protein